MNRRAAVCLRMLRPRMGWRIVMKRIGIAAFTARGRELADRIADGLRQKAEKTDLGEKTVDELRQKPEAEGQTVTGLRQKAEPEEQAVDRLWKKTDLGSCPADDPRRPAYEIWMYESGLKDWCRAQFESHSDGIIFVGAAGIAVRSIAPFLKSKTTDPAVLVIDEAGQYVISLLSGHIGGANRLALMVAEMINAVPVITTATDVNGKFAVDVFAKDNHLKIGSMKAAKEISAAILRGEPVGLYCEGKIKGTVPPELRIIQENNRKKCGAEFKGRDETELAESGSGIEKGCPRYLICICGRLPKVFDQVILHLIPKSHVLGIGCRRGKTEGEIEAEVSHALAQAEVSMDQIFAAATIDLKKEEQGLLAFCERHGLKLETYTAEELLEVPGDFSSSEFVRKTTGVDNVCERAALRMAGAGGRLIQKKYAGNGVTAAVAVRDWSVHFEK